MAEIECRWTKNDKPIRISEFATNLGFNLKLLEYNGIQENKMDWVNKKLQSSIIAYLSETWEEDRFLPLSVVGQT